MLPDGTAQRIVERDQGARRADRRNGRSIAAGEGNPDRAVWLSDEGFCFRRLDGGEYYRPGRAGFSGNKSCTPIRARRGAGDWARQSARWMSGACHRSLYSYQMRAALAFAVENHHMAVTYIPLGCTGATIDSGFLDSQRASECPGPGTSAPVRDGSRRRSPS